MRRLLNTLYVTSEDSYLALDGENIVVLTGEQEAGRLPLHTLESVISFGYRGTSPALMGAWIEIYCQNSLKTDRLTDGTHDWEPPVSRSALFLT